MLAEDERADGREHNDHHELRAGKRNAVHPLHIMIHREDLRSEGKGAEENIEITAAERYGAAVKAEEIKPRHGKEHIDPGALLRLFAQHDAEHRHEHDIKRRDKARLACGRRFNAELLQIDAECKEEPADQAAAQQRALFLRGILLARANAPHDKQQQQQRQCRRNGTQRVEAEAAEMPRAETLGHKGAAPDHRRDQRQNDLADFRIFHSCLLNITHVTM